MLLIFLFLQHLIHEDLFLEDQHTVLNSPRRSHSENPDPVRIWGLTIAVFVRNAGLTLHIVHSVYSVSGDLLIAIAYLFLFTIKL